MPAQAFLVAYDIACPRRLRRVARAMEKAALRVQKSVFLFQGDRLAVLALLERVRPLLDLDLDIVQAWKLANPAAADLVAGAPSTCQPAAVVLYRAGALFVD